MRRYFTDPKIAGKFYGTARAAFTIQQQVKAGRLTVVRRILKEGERLDTIAGEIYKNSSLWWIIAAASDVGWGLQIPPGTVLTIPTKLTEIQVLVG